MYIGMKEDAEKVWCESELLIMSYGCTCVRCVFVHKVLFYPTLMGLQGQRQQLCTG